MEEQKKKILEIAFTLFSKYGIKGVTMDDISKELGMSKKTLYIFFSDKNTLVLEITEMQLNDSEKKCTVFCNNSKDPIHEIFLIMEMIKNKLENTNPAMLYDMKKYHKEAWGLMEKHENEFIFNMIIHNLTQGVELGLYRKSLKVDIIARMRLAIMKLGFTPEMNPNNKYSLDEIQICLLNHFLMGITTLKGNQLVEEYKQKLNNIDEN